MEEPRRYDKAKNESGFWCCYAHPGYLFAKAMLRPYHSLLLSHVRYCITNCCFGNETRIHQLQRICNKFIRLVFGLKKRDSVKNVMKQNGLY